MKTPKLTLEDISKYTPQMGVGREILDDICKYIPKIAKRIGTTISVIALVSYLAACPSPNDDDDNGDNGNGDVPVVIYDESKGANIMAEEIGKRLTVEHNTENTLANVTYPGGSTTFIPDIHLINNGVVVMYGEFISGTDGLTSQQRSVIEGYNSQSGSPVGKTVLANPDTASNIRARVNHQLDDYGL